MLMLLLQEIVQGLISKHSSLETFLKWDVVFERVEFKNEGEVLSIERASNIVTVTMNEPCQSFEFNPYQNTPKWGEVACSLGDVVCSVYEINEGQRLFIGKEYLRFKQYANQFAAKLESDDWVNVARLVGAQEPDPVKSEVVPVETFTRFQTIIHKILAKNDLMDAFYNPSCEMVYLKLQQESYMDLVIERQYETVFVGHYMKQNGDLISDPILVFQLSKGTRSWAPYRIEQIFGDTQIMFEQEGKTMIYTNRLKEFKSFANFFGKNIKDQNWIEAEAIDKRSFIEEEKEDDIPEPIVLTMIPEIIDYTAGQMAFGF